MDTLRKRLVDKVAGAFKRIEEYVHDDDSAVVLQVERSVQLDSYSCGAQATYVILRYHGKARSPAAVARALGTDEDGTWQTAIMRLVRQRKLVPIVRANARLRDLEDAIDEGAPALVSLNGGGHWAVVYGYSKTHIYVADSSSRRVWSVVPRRAFLGRWDRWAMVVRARR